MKTDEKGYFTKMNKASTILMTFFSHILYHMHKSDVNVDGCLYNTVCPTPYRPVRIITEMPGLVASGTPCNNYSIMESSLKIGHIKIELAISNSKTVTVPTIKV